MSRMFLRLVAQAEAGEIDRLLHSQPHQLSLFDDYLHHRISCFSMYNINGEYFSRSVAIACPRYVLDLRRFPYFDLLTLRKEDVFKIFIKIGAEYYHRPLEFEGEGSLAEHWQFRSKLFRVFEDLDFDERAMQGSIAVLVNNKYEAEEISLALRPTGPNSVCWKLSIL